MRCQAQELHPLLLSSPGLRPKSDKQEACLRLCLRIQPDSTTELNDSDSNKNLVGNRHLLLTLALDKKAAGKQATWHPFQACLFSHVEKGLQKRNVVTWSNKKEQVNVGLEPQNMCLQLSQRRAGS